MQVSTIKTTIRELEAVNAKLAAQRVSGAARLELLRRQAELGDLRDEALVARRKAAAPPAH